MAAIKRFCQILGVYDDLSVAGTQTLSLNAAGTWLAFSFIPSKNDTLSFVKAVLSGVTGTLASSDLVCFLYSNSGSTPGTSLEGPKSTVATPAAGWMQWQGFTTSLTAGTMYWLVFRNQNASPTSNFPTFRFGGSGLGPLIAAGGPNATYSWMKKHSTNSGSTWGTTTTRTGGWYVGYGSGDVDGAPIDSVTTTAAADGVYGARELGSYFTMPSSISPRVLGIAMPAGKNGTPSGNLRFRLYRETTLLATTLSIAQTDVSNTVNFLFAYFANAVLLAPGGNYRVVLSEETNTDTSINRYNSREYDIENHADAKSLMPFDNLKKTYFDESTWTETEAAFVPFALILDPAQELGGIHVGFYGSMILEGRDVVGY